MDGARRHAAGRSAGARPARSMARSRSWPASVTKGMLFEGGVETHRRSRSRTCGTPRSTPTSRARPGRSACCESRRRAPTRSLLSGRHAADPDDPSTAERRARRRGRGAEARGVRRAGQAGRPGRGPRWPMDSPAARTATGGAARDSGGEGNGARSSLLHFSGRPRGGGSACPMPDPRGSVLLAGVSTRALAESAARAGYRVIAVDAFGDADLRAVADVVAARPDRRAALSAADAGRTGGAPGALPTPRRLHLQLREPSRTPWPCSRGAAGCWAILHACSSGYAIPSPAARASPPAGSPSRAPAPARPAPSLRRRVALEAPPLGRRPRHHGLASRPPCPRSGYLQARIAGHPGRSFSPPTAGTSFRSASHAQLVGMPAFGSHGFRYCGSLLAGEASLLRRATESCCDGRGARRRRSRRSSGCGASTASTSSRATVCPTRSRSIRGTPRRWSWSSASSALSLFGAARARLRRPPSRRSRGRPRGRR